MESKRRIGFWDLVFMNVSACYGIRWLAKSTALDFGLGIGSISMWVLFSFIFFVPQALIAAEFAATYPKEGGIMEWVKEAFGEKWGFMVSWLNWTAKIFWFSAFLTFLGVDIAYMLGMQGLALNRIYILVLSLVTLWSLSLACLKGMGKAKIFTNLGAFGSMIPTIFLLVMAFLSVFVLKKPAASTYSVHTILPQLNADSLVAISTLMYGLSGTEMAANFINEVENPRKNYPRAIITSAAIVATMYVVGSIAMTMILTPDQITASTGLFDALGTAAHNLGIGDWLMQVLAGGIALSLFGGLILNIAQPVKMLFGSVKKGVFPEKIMKTNEVHIPTRAVIFQAVFVSILLLLVVLIPSVDTVYNVLVSMTALSSLFPYSMMFAAYVKLRKNRPNEYRPYQMVKNNQLAVGIGYFILAITVIGAILTATPVMDTVMQNVFYEIEMIGGAILVIASGLAIWSHYERKVARGKVE